MPELPEVETITRQLNKTVVGRTFADAWNDWPRQLKTHSLASFRKAIKGLRITKVHRRHKFIMFDLTGGPSAKLGAGKTLVIHQKISGHLLYGKWKKDKASKTGWTATEEGPLKSDPFNRHVRFIFWLDNGCQLALSDVRRFGRVYLGDTDKIEHLGDIDKLGPEPLELASNKADFANLFKNKRGKIKQVLMDPRFIAGIGNIYSDEILWYAGVNPLKRVETIKSGQIEAIRAATLSVLNKSIKAKGDSQQDYRDLYGEFGSYQKMHRAYQQTGKKCAKGDGGIIKRVKIGSRSCHFCPRHQK